jgi:AcrR family transcriptional regulator
MSSDQLPTVRASAVADRARSTRTAIIDAARELFMEKGYFETSTEEIVAAAGVGTRGALYHHFADKRALFAAVFELLELEIVASAAATDTAGSALERLRQGLLNFLEAARAPRVQRILLIDGPAVLGWQQWRALEEEHGLGVIGALLERAVAGGELEPQPTRVMAHLLLAVVNDAALFIANADDPDRAAQEAAQAFNRIFDGISAAP